VSGFENSSDIMRVTTSKRLDNVQNINRMHQVEMLNFSSINTMKPLLVWVAARHGFLRTNNLVQCIGPIFKGQDVQEEGPKK
jgi:hypothetical protein